MPMPVITDADNDVLALLSRVQLDAAALVGVSLVRGYCLVF